MAGLLFFDTLLVKGAARQLVLGQGRIKSIFGLAELLIVCCRLPGSRIGLLS